MTNPLAKMSVLQLKRAVAIREQMQTWKANWINSLMAKAPLGRNLVPAKTERQNERRGEGQTLRDDDGKMGEDQGGKGQEVIIGYPSGRVGRRL
jgi:hypothetical protein